MGEIFGARFLKRLCKLRKESNHVVGIFKIFTVYQCSQSKSVGSLTFNPLPWQQADNLPKVLVDSGRLLNKTSYYLLILTMECEMLLLI